MKPINKESAWKMLEQMVLCRRFEEATIKAYQQKFITGFLHTYIGQEACAVGAMAHMTDEDSFVTSYRCHAQGLIAGMTPRSIMAELYGKITGCVRGKGGSMHVFSKQHKHLGGHGIVGGQIPIGAGAAFANRYQGGNGINLCYFGDGASMQGVFHECMNLASLWNIPVIYICENNMYGMGTRNDRALSNTEVQEFAAAYKVNGYKVDGMDLVASHEAFGKIIEEARRTSRPALVNVITYRYKGHSVSDAANYRTAEELQCWVEKDPIGRFFQHMQKQGWIDDDGYKALEKKVKDIVTDSVQFAEESPWPPMDELAKHTYAD